jgi:hypothetical protein
MGTRAIVMAGLVASLAVAGFAGTAGAKPPGNLLQVQRLPTVVPSADVERLRVVQEAAAGKLEVRDLSVLGDPVHLDVRRAIVGDEARLSFECAYMVVPADNKADFVNLPGQTPRLRIEFKAPAPGMYVVEAVVRSGTDHGSGVPAGAVEMVYMGGTKQTSLLSYGKETRLGLFVDATSAGWQTVILQSRDSPWSFRSADISRFR